MTSLRRLGETRGKTTMMRRWFAALVVLMGMAGAGVAVVAPAASAATATCLVVDTNSGQS